MTPLSELLDALRADGFPIGVDDHVRVGRLLALPTPWSEDELRVAVRAVIAKDVRERAAFDAVWARVFPARVQPAHPFEGRVPHFDEMPNAAKRRYYQQRRRARRRIAGVVALFAVVVVVAAAVTRWRTHDETIRPEAGVGWYDDGGPTIDDGGVVVAQPDPLVHAARVTAPPPEEPARDDTPDLAMIGGGGALLVVCIALGVIARRRRTTAVRGPFRYTPKIPEAHKPVLASRDIEDAAANLTWQAEVAGAELDLDRTVHATVAAGGLPSFVYRAPPAAPSYVVLEDTERPWSFVYDELLRGLAREGVTIERWTFLGDPSWCTNGRERRPLRDVVEHCDALIAIGAADTAFDPLANAAPDWVRVLRHVPKRLWINPLPEARWSRGAHEIARDTIMEHGVASALAALRAGADRRDRPDAPLSAIALRAPASAPGLAALQAHLGPDGMRLVGALALAGAPSAATARWLAERFKTVDPTAPRKLQRRGPTPEPPRGIALDDAAWLRVLALPWLSDGAWPPELQAKLAVHVRHTDPALAKAVDAAMTEVITASEPPLGSAAHLRWQLDVASRTSNPDVRALRASPLHREVEQRFGRRPAWLAATAIAGALVAMLGAGRYAVAHLRGEPVVVDAAIDAPIDGLPNPPDAPADAQHEFLDDGMPPFVPPDAAADRAGELATLVNKSTGRLQQCYARAVEATPALRATTKMQLGVTLDPDGSATLGKLSVPSPDGGLRACVASIVKTWRVSPGAGESMVMTLAFTPLDDPKLAQLRKAETARDWKRVEDLLRDDPKLATELDPLVTELVKSVASDAHAGDCARARTTLQDARQVAAILSAVASLDRTPLVHGADQAVDRCVPDVGHQLSALAKANHGTLDACFALAKAPKSRNVEVAVVVEADGSISEADTRSIGEDDPEHCIMHEVMRWRLPDAPGGQTRTVLGLNFAGVKLLGPRNGFVVVEPPITGAGVTKNDALLAKITAAAKSELAKTTLGDGPSAAQTGNVVGFDVTGILAKVTVTSVGDDQLKIDCSVSVAVATYPDKHIFETQTGAADTTTQKSGVEAVTADCVGAAAASTFALVFKQLQAKLAPAGD